MVHTLLKIQQATICFFRDAYKTRGGTCIEDQIWGSNSYPTMFDSDKNGELYKPINIEEFHRVLKYFTKYKCPRPNRGMVEFFLQFIDLIGPDLLQMVEQSRLGGHITGETNSNSITLIPKHGDLGSFTDYRPI